MVLVRMLIVAISEVRDMQCYNVGERFGSWRKRFVGEAVIGFL